MRQLSLRVGFFWFVLAAILSAFAAPALAQEDAAPVDPRSLIIDPPAPGFIGVPAEEGGDTRITQVGEPAPADYKPPALSGFTQGHLRVFVNPNTGDIVTTMAMQYTSPAVAKVTMGADKRDLQGAGMTLFDVPDLPNSQGFVGKEGGGALGGTQRTVEFRYANYLVAVHHEAPPGVPPSAEFVTSVAADHFELALLSVPFDEVDEGEASAIETGQTIRRWLGEALIALGVLVIVGGTLLVVLVRRSRRRRAAMRPTVFDGYGSIVPDGQPMPAPTGHAGTVWGASPDPSTMAPTEAFRPAPPTAPNATAPAAAPPPAAPMPVAPMQNQECPSCRNVFGPEDTCATCQALRTMCVVCGVRIWAGAMTCAAHSGVRATTH